MPNEESGVAETRPTCCYCAVGCGVILEHGGERSTSVRNSSAHEMPQDSLSSGMPPSIMSPAMASAICGLNKKAIEMAAEWFASAAGASRSRARAG
ncbi:MAG: hypothetical protein AB7S62_00995 [Azoarcus sp.]